MYDICMNKKRNYSMVRRATVIAVLAILMLSGCSPKSKTVVLRPVVEASESSSVDLSDVAETAKTTEKVSKDSSGTEATQFSTVYVYVCGEVKQEGVYELPAGSRVFDAIDAAGGFGSGADTSYINQAAPITDGIKIRIPEKSETGQKNDQMSEPVISAGITPQEEQSTDQPQKGLININTADEKGLCDIPGIGSGRAKDILRYRTEHGDFKKIEEIMQVTGIKEKLFAKIKDSITV